MPASSSNQTDRIFILSPERTPPVVSIIPPATIWLVTVPIVTIPVPVTVPTAITPEFAPVLAQPSPVLPDFTSFVGDFRSRSAAPEKTSQLAPVMVELAPIVSQFSPLVANLAAPAVKSALGKSRLAHQKSGKNANTQTD